MRSLFGFGILKRKNYEDTFLYTGLNPLLCTGRMGAKIGFPITYYRTAKGRVP